jgi:hypothetical protein
MMPRNGAAQLEIDEVPIANGGTGMPARLLAAFLPRQLAYGSDPYLRKKCAPFGGNSLLVARPPKISTSAAAEAG